MQPAHGTGTTSAADAGHAPALPVAHDVAIDDLYRKFAGRWAITPIDGGYRATLRDSDTNGRKPVILYGRTPGELAESIRLAEYQAVRTWDVYTRLSPLPPGLLNALTSLRTGLPGYDVTVTRAGGRFRYEAIRRHGHTGPWCVISTDPADLWRELAGCTRSGNTAGSPARAP